MRRTAASACSSNKAFVNWPMFGPDRAALSSSCTVPSGVRFGRSSSLMRRRPRAWRRCSRRSCPVRGSEMHLDARLALVVPGLMRELRNVELAVELPINAREQVEIERCGDADGVVVGADEALARFDQIR